MYQDICIIYYCYYCTS